MLIHPYFRKKRAMAMVSLTTKKLVFEFKNAYISDVDLTLSQPYPKPGNRPLNTIAKRFPNPNLNPKSLYRTPNFALQNRFCCEITLYH